MMIAVLNPSAPVAKRQKLCHEPTSWFYEKPDDKTVTRSLCALDDYCDIFDIEEDDDDENPENLESEEDLLDHVLGLYEIYEEESLYRQSKLRYLLSSQNTGNKCVKREKNLKDEKSKLILLKVLTLLLRTESRLKGSNHAERMDLMQRFKHCLSNAREQSLEKIKSFFVQLCTAREEPIFPPCSITVPHVSLRMAESGSREIDESELIRKTFEWMTLLEESSKKALQKRLEHGNYSENEEDEWENARDVWNVWLQFTPTSPNQLAVWEESLQDGKNVDDILWNLAFYLSIGELEG